MAVNLIRSTRLFPDAPYAYAARASQDDLIFTAGACPLYEQGGPWPPGNVRAQMGQALGNLRTALEDSGATVRDVLKTTVYVASSTLLGVAVLGYPGQLVEIEAIAVTPAR